MKKNFLIMMIMLLCSGFAFAQINTVRGFVPGAGTGDGTNAYQTYAVFGQMFGDIDLTAANPYEVAEGLAQAQLLADTFDVVIACDDTLAFGEFVLSADDVQSIIEDVKDKPTRDTFLTIQHANAADYNYDQLLVLHLFVCPCSVNDCADNEYEVFALNNYCWTKPSMRATVVCNKDCESTGDAIDHMAYSTELTPSVDATTFGLLYTWESAIAGATVTDSDYVQGICPCGWHIPTAAEVDTILKSATNDLRSAAGNWVTPEGITNDTKFTAEPVGYYNATIDRFEGHHSEVDFWYVSADSTAAYFQILYYCDKPKQEPRNASTDAMSVRCVRDLIYEYKEANKEEDGE